MTYGTLQFDEGFEPAADDGRDEGGPRNRRRGRWARSAIATFTVAAVAFAGGRMSVGESPPVPASVNVDTTSADPAAGDSLSEIIASATQSIVSVETVSYAGPFGQQASGKASGVILRADGIVVTNAHVIEGATEISVTTSEGAEHPASVVGSDPAHDIALLRVDAAGLTPITVGSSDDLQLGDDVVALGYPLGLGTTATRGIVSGLDRTIRVGDGPFATSELRGLLQTDAAINPGNSGGALLDSEGRLIGINTAAASASAAENIGFAVAIDEALPIVEELLEVV